MRYPYDCNNLKAAIKCLFRSRLKLEEINTVLAAP